MTDKWTRKKFVVYGTVFLVLFYVFNRLSFLFRISSGNAFEKLVSVQELLPKYFFGMPSFHMIDVLVGILVILIIFVLIDVKSSERKRYKKGEEYGTARWGTKSDIAPYSSGNYFNNLLLSQTEKLMVNEKPSHPKYDRNKNVLVIGGSGSGKTRFVIKPNLMQMNTSYVVTDSKGSLVEETGQMFSENNYDVRILNLIDFTKSMGYNPFVYIKTQSDVMEFVDMFFSNTSSGNKNSTADPFWDDAGKMLLRALVALVIKHGKEKDKNFRTIMTLFNAMEAEENDDNVVTSIFKLIKEYNPDDYAYSQYLKFRHSSEKTAQSILVTLGARLAIFDNEDIKKLTDHDQMDLLSIGDQKTILYIMVSDSNPTYNFLAGILYSQMFNGLMEKADQYPSHKLPVPIQFYLDEFANIGKIPNFEKLIATIRSRGMSAMIVLQSIAQLKEKYQDTMDTIIGNCDTEIFLGGKEQTTLKRISETLGKETIDMTMQNENRGREKSYSTSNSRLGRELMTLDEIATMPNSQSIVLIRGVRPFLSQKFQLESHPNYTKIWDGNNLSKFFNVKDYIKQTKPTFKESSVPKQNKDAESFFAVRRKDGQLTTISTNALDVSSMGAELEENSNYQKIFYQMIKTTN